MGISKERIKEIDELLRPYVYTAPECLHPMVRAARELRVEVDRLCKDLIDSILSEKENRTSKETGDCSECPLSG